VLSPNQQKAIAALLTSKSNEEAARQSGISPRTLSRYLSDPAFKAEYQKAFNGLVERATRQAQRNLTPAVSTLQEIMQDPEQNGQVRVSAARSLLEYSMKLSERVDILERLDELEEAMKRG
jgi:catalase (peroxidase I)